MSIEDTIKQRIESKQTELDAMRNFYDGGLKKVQKYVSDKNSTFNELREPRNGQTVHPDNTEYLAHARVLSELVGEVELYARTIARLTQEINGLKDLLEKSE